MIRPTTCLKLCFAIALTLGAFNAKSYAAGDPNGTWKWSFTTANGQQIDFSLDLKREGDKLTGKLALPMGDAIDIKDGTFKDDEVAFQVTFERNGNMLTTK